MMSGMAALSLSGVGAGEMPTISTQKNVVMKSVVLVQVNLKSISIQCSGVFLILSRGLKLLIFFWGGALTPVGAQKNSGNHRFHRSPINPPNPLDPHLKSILNLLFKELII